MRKITKNISDFLVIMAALIALTGSIFYLDPTIWESLVAMVARIQIPNVGFGLLDLVTVLAVIVGLICTLALTLKHKQLLRKPANIKLVR